MPQGMPIHWLMRARIFQARSTKSPRTPCKPMKLSSDRGYPSEGREAWLKENGFRNQIQRKGKRNKPLTECQQRRNQRIAKTRARVEHVFGALEQMGGKLLRTIGQARASFAMTMMAACYNLKRLVYFRKAGIEAF